MTFPIFTIGYQGQVQAQLLDRLASAAISTLLDIRAVPQSRKPGFSKTLLGNSAMAREINYVHLRALGTPKAGRIAARAGRASEMEAVFAAHMASDAAQAGLREAIAVASAAPTCLLCFESDPHLCHRRIVAEAIAAHTGQAIQNL